MGRMLGKRVLLADGREGCICCWGHPGARSIRKASRRAALDSGRPYLLIEIYAPDGYEMKWVTMDDIMKVL